MNFVFHIGRSNYYKFLTSLIEEGLKRGHTIECWHDYTQPREGMKYYLFPTIEDSPFFNCGNNNIKFKKIENEGDYEKLLCERRIKDDIDYFVGLSPVNVQLKESIIEYLSEKWCIIMHGIDSYFELKSLPVLKNNNYNRFIFTYSEYFYQFEPFLVFFLLLYYQHQIHMSTL